MSSDSRVRPAPIDLKRYRPDLPEEEWAHIRKFVVLAADDALPGLNYAEASVVNAIAHHVDWCVNGAGYSMTRETVFRRDVIGTATAVMDTTQNSTRGRRRSLLLRVGEALDVIPRTPQLTPLSAAKPSTPYTLDEVDGIWQWAARQLDGKQIPAQVIAVLGLGAGLAPRDLCAVRPVDVVGDGRAIEVAGRTVPVNVDWQDDLRAIVSRADDTTAPIFRPNIVGSKNMVTNFVASCANEGIRPSTQRMRATWLVDHMAAGTPMQDLLWWAGLKSMDALVRYERFLPPPSQVALEGTS
ncbi:hypothetical protein ACTJKH_07405 [Microbacterium sp. 22215]|uniref:hypothetical protein n=1 Tax=Microbacterium sp. 22215 TaxID=3453893 RepID=UPI003F82648E